MAKLTRLSGDAEIVSKLRAYANVRTVTDTATVDADDNSGLVIGTKGTGFTITVPADVFEVGNTFDIMQGGAGAVTVAAGSNATVNVDATYTKVTAGQYSIITVTCYAANTFVVTGNAVPA